MRDAPERDGRVVWLIDQIGGSAGIAHRREDILRRRFGRASRETAAPWCSREATASSRRWCRMQMRQAHWRQQTACASGAGSLRRLSLSFGRAMTFEAASSAGGTPRDLQDSSGGQWPITELVVQLNNRFPPRNMDGRSRGQRKKTIAEVDQTSDAKKRPR